MGGVVAECVAAGLLVVGLQQGSLPATILAVLLVLGGLSVVAALVFRANAVRFEGRQVSAALLRAPPRRVTDAMQHDGIYVLGVAPEAQDALRSVEPQIRHAPYLPRDVDSELEVRLRRAAAKPAASLVVLAGPAKSGKSRTLLEVLRRTLPEAWLLEPTDGAALANLANEERAVARSSGPYVIWLDDLERFVGVGSDGLSPATLRRFDRWARPVLILAGCRDRERWLTQRPQARVVINDLLLEWPPVELSAHLTSGERDALVVHPVYGPVAQKLSDGGIGQFMVAAGHIRQILDQDECPEGKAVVHAASDWCRCGLLRAVPPDVLEEMYVVYLSGAASSERFEIGLSWATRPLYPGVALLLREEGGYAAFDYIVSLDDERGRPIPSATWDAIISRYASPEEWADVGLAASHRGESAVADRALRRADEEGSAEAGYRRADEIGSADGAARLGMLLHQRLDLEGAEAAYRRADERGSPEGAINLGFLLHQRGDLEAAEAAYRRADERGSAVAAANLGILLAERGDLASAEAALDRAAQRGSPDASVNLGLVLEARGDLSAAEVSYRRADSLGSLEAANNLGVLLEKIGDLGQAEAAFRRADQRGSADAAANLGALLQQRGDMQGAEAAFRRADNRNHAGGALGLAALLQLRGDQKAADAAYRRAAERSGTVAPSQIGVPIDTTSSREDSQET